MSYATPYYPHELDTHPDAARIQATIDAATAPFEQELADQEERHDEQVYEAVREAEEPLESRIETLEEELRDALRATDDDDARIYLDLLQEIAVAALNGSGQRLAAAFSELGDVLEKERGMARVDLFELEGCAEHLAAVLT